ncbi:hypothetical protein CCGE531_31355 (plasmid) [Rhizobium sp. CCGE531]|nr:hypothetical protein CCGE531_31355 [Rhizobium sp. CCGE531]
MLQKAAEPMDTDGAYAPPKVEVLSCSQEIAAMKGLTENGIDDLQDLLADIRSAERPDARCSANRDCQLSRQLVRTQSCW